MTREYAVEMINAIKNGLHETGKDFPYRDEIIPIAKEALEMAITELEQAPCEDAISRQAVEDACDQSINLFEAVDRIKELPPVKPAEKVGQWIDGKCNRCGTHAPYWAMASTYYCSDYCPKCKAKMQEV